MGELDINDQMSDDRPKISWEDDDKIEKIATENAETDNQSVFK